MNNFGRPSENAWDLNSSAYMHEPPFSRLASLSIDLASEVTVQAIDTTRRAHPYGAL